MGVVAGYGVQLWPILQDIHQLRATYVRSAGILSNADVLQVFGISDVETAELIGKAIGKRPMLSAASSPGMKARPRRHGTSPPVI
ncbi:TraM recognition domain-containing protein [Agrobacterium sp. Ap1]|uniref:TraM recognition domain-containing protein n=1 Tax=Agrobacterium sp. Ap1 TaxID=2815337 RepID=UPI002570397E|nr:TraM recognition domain-containing protein [Agrobacterium sp. Ap1]